jgi:hypothetical protein
MSTINNSDSTVGAGVGKESMDWLIKCFFSALSRHTAFSAWWNHLDLIAQTLVIEDLRDELRYRL